jgi:hypothetical protein
MEDYPVAIAGATGTEASFRRTITVRAEHPIEHLFLRAAVGKHIKETDGVFAVDETLRLKFPDARPIIRNSEGNAELLVPLTFSGNEAKLNEELTW